MEDYLTLPYHRVFTYIREDDYYFAQVLEFPGCMSDGKTLDEANAHLNEAITGWTQTKLQGGFTVPPPLTSKEYTVILRKNGDR
jgi:predicted RNase H-like HicB family nuclease